MIVKHTELLDDAGQLQLLPQKLIGFQVVKIFSAFDGI
jgi:hypothetical protein